MRMLDNIRERLTDRKVDKLYKDAIAITSRSMVPKILDEQIMEESPEGIYRPTVVSSEMFKKSRPAGRKLSRYIMEKRRTTRKTFTNLTIIQSPYSYDRIDSFYERESYFSRSLVRQVETMLRNGFEFASEDADMLRVTKQEIARIEMDSGMPFNQFIFSLAMHLLKYGVAIVHKVRERVKDEIAIDNKRKSRITRLRIVNPHDVFVYVNDKGRIVGIYDNSSNIISQAVQQLIMGRSFNGIIGDDLVFFYMSDPGDEIFPEPPCFQMLDDVLTLRSIEETVELLTFQFGSPLLHAKVGDEDYTPTPVEIANVNTQLTNIAPNGMITTDHRVKIDVVNIQKAVTNLLPYLEYFKTRVLIGSGSSPVSVGEGDTANRNTAESIDDALADHCTYVANAIASPINYNLIPDLLVRSDTSYTDEKLFDDLGELKVRMEFNETRLEKQIAHANNVINLWQGNLLKFTEARRALKKAPFKGKKDDEELYVNKVQIPLNESKSSMNVSNLTKSQTQPTNQYGTKAGPGSRKD